MVDNLNTFKARYPQYQNVPDDVLASNLYDKFYQEKMSRSDFYNKIGYREPGQPGIGGVIQDVATDVYNLPSVGAATLKKLTTEIPGAAGQVLSDPQRAQRNISAGGLEFGRGLLNAPHVISKYLEEKEFLPKGFSQSIPKMAEKDFSEYLRDLPQSAVEKTLGFLEEKGLAPKGFVERWREEDDLRKKKDLEVKAGDALLKSVVETPAWMIPGGAATQAAKFGLLGAAHETSPVTLLGLQKAGEVLPKVPGAVKRIPEKVKSASKKTGKIIGDIVDHLGKKGKKPEVPPEIQEVLGFGEKHGVTVLPGDIAPYGSAGQIATTLGEQFRVLPRKDQLTSAGEAADKVLKKQQIEMVKTKFGGEGGLDKIKKIAEEGGPRSVAARKVLDSIAEAGEDWNKILQASGSTQLLLNKLRADELYAVVDKLAGDSPVPLDNFFSSIDATLKELAQHPSLYKNEIAFLREFRKDIATPKTKPSPETVGELLGITKREPIPAIKDISFGNARKLRSKLRKKINDFYKGKDPIGETGIDVMHKIGNALEKDMDNFATKAGGEIQKSKKAADKYYKEKVVPYKEKQMKKFLDSKANPDELFNMVVKRGKIAGDVGTGAAEKLFKALDDKGRAAVRYGIVKRALGKSVDDRGFFSPKKFVREMGQYKAAREVFFKGKGKRQIDGFEKLMSYIGEAGSLKIRQTGYGAIPIFTALGLVASGKVLAGAVGYTGLWSLFNTQAGRNLLIELSYMNPGSKGFKSAINRVNNIVKKSTKNKEALKTLSPEQRAALKAPGAALAISQGYLSEEDR